MITDVHRPRLLPYAAILAPPSKAGDVTRQNALTADIRARNRASAANELSRHVRVVCHAHDIGQIQPTAQGGQQLTVTTPEPSTMQMLLVSSETSMPT